MALVLSPQARALRGPQTDSFLQPLGSETGPFERTEKNAPRHTQLLHDPRDHLRPALPRIRQTSTRISIIVAVPAQGRPRQ
jgi:hypothetical protein